MKSASFHYLHYHAQMMVQLAIAHGDLCPASHCEQCGCKQDFRALNAHHKDYRYPLEVVWLCSVCHGRTHRGGVQVSPTVYLTKGVVLAIEWLKANDPQGAMTVREASVNAGMSTGIIGAAKKHLRENGGLQS